MEEIFKDVFGRDFVFRYIVIVGVVGVYFRFRGVYLRGWSRFQFFFSLKFRYCFYAIRVFRQLIYYVLGSVEILFSSCWFFVCVDICQFSVGERILEVLVGLWVEVYFWKFELLWWLFQILIWCFGWCRYRWQRRWLF